MKVFVAGATGFVGSHIVKKLVAHGHSVIALAHKRSDEVLKGAAVEKREGSILDLNSLRSTAKGAEAIVNAVGIIKEVKGKTFDGIHRQGVENLIAAAKENGIKRFIHISALGTGAGIDTAYFRTKEAGEKVLMASGLDWTIFRPSMIVGPGDGFSTEMLALMKKGPFIPVIGKGEYKLQMVYIEDVAECVALALQKPETIGQTYCLGGPDIMTMNEVLDFLARWKGIHKPKIHIPLFIMRPAAAIMKAVLPNPPVTLDQIRMLLAAFTCDPTVASRVFEVTFKPWADAIKEYS
ncbi:MAG: complex I NDUFA9 subunit family protein [candidate division Zixibacteria bacterium]|nr:complex I NDUFA9 subunit family protein [candidate division Zixibacteria bacterium]